MNWNAARLYDFKKNVWSPIAILVFIVQFFIYNCTPSLLYASQGRKTPGVISAVSEQRLRMSEISSIPTKKSCGASHSAYTEGEVIVQFKKGVCEDEAVTILETHGMTVVKRLKRGRPAQACDEQMLVRSIRGMSTAEMIAELADNEHIDIVEPVYFLHTDR